MEGGDNGVGCGLVGDETGATWVVTVVEIWDSTPFGRLPTATKGRDNKVMTTYEFGESKHNS